MFELALFSTDCRLITAAVAAGVSAVVIDWELEGKRERQAGMDTQIGTDTVEDLQHVRRCTKARVICRTERYGEATRAQIDVAIAGGADEVLLPMVRGIEEVEAAIQHARGRIGVGILIETEQAVNCTRLLARLPLARVYVGLNDLAIARGSHSIFDSVADGTVERVRRHFTVPFGFGGLTLPERGWPIPCRLLIGEMARLECSFSFLRRSFRRDLAGTDVSRAVPRLLGAMRVATRRTPHELCRDRDDLVAVIATLNGSEASGRTEWAGR